MVVAHQKKDVFNYKNNFMQILGEKKFYCISSRLETSGQLYGCFKIGPFYGHQSLTFANALRRTLLADNSRCVLEAIQIYGVEHEFSNLIGVRESVIDILLNLEKILFQIQKPITKPLIAVIDFHGPGIVRAQNINLPLNLKCIMPSQYIATIETDGKFKAKLFFTPNWNKIHSLIQTNLIQLKKKKISTNLNYNLKTLNTIWTRKSNFKLLVNKFITIKKHFFIKRLTFFALSPLKKKKKNFKKLISKTKKNKTLFQENLEIITKENHNFGNYLQKSDSLEETHKENLLFLKSSTCAIKKVHYTLQMSSKRRYGLTKKVLNNNSTSLKHYLKLNFQRRQPFNKSIRKNFLISPKNSEEYILFEVWTDGSLHPQVAILRALNELLLDIFPYNLHIIKNEKINFLNFPENLKFKNPKFLSFPENLEFLQKFLNLEIANFHFDLETYLFLKQKKIHRIVDFLNLLATPSKQNQINTTFQWKKNLNNLYNSNLFTIKIDNLNITPQIKNTLYKFQKFIEFVIK